jgi:site-specific recombinase XerD
VKTADHTDLIVSEWLMGFQPTTRTTYRHAVREFAGFHTGDLLEVTRPDVQRWVRHLTDDLLHVPATVRKKTSALSSFYDYAVDQKHMAHNPCEHVRRPQGESAPRQGLSLEQAQALLKAATDHGKTALALVWLMAGAGLRITEACTARIEHLDTAQALLTVTVKRGHRQIKPLSPSVLQAVLAVIGDRTTGTILTNVDDNPLTRHRGWELIEKLTKQTHITDCTPHTLRHTAATLALEAGVPVQDVQQLLGHKNIETTLRYIRNRDILGATRNAANHLETVLLGPQTEGTQLSGVED